MLDSRGVADLAERHGLGGISEQLRARVRAGWRLELARGLTNVGASRVGGEPDLTPDESWPLNPDGVPLVFLAQIDCATLPALGDYWPSVEWQHGGALLRLFADLIDNGGEPRPAVVLACSDRAALQRVPQPADPLAGRGPFPEHRACTAHLPESAVTAVPFLTAPEVWGTHEPDEIPDELLEDYEEWAMTLRVEGRGKDLCGPFGSRCTISLANPRRSKTTPATPARRFAIRASGGKSASVEALRPTRRCASAALGGCCWACMTTMTPG